MSIPTDQFAQLTLESPLQSSDTEMAPAEEVKARALQLQDILSSFDETELPSEFRANTLSNIYQHMESPSGLGRNHTIPGDLHGTLLQHGSYDDDFWAPLSKLYTPEDCARLLYEKLDRRFAACFEAYDEACDRLADDPAPAATIKASLQPILNDLVRLSVALRTDRERRPHIKGQAVPLEAETLDRPLWALRQVCQRAEPVVPLIAESSRRSTRRTTPAKGDNLSLFGMLVRRADFDEPFLLQALENFSGTALKQRLEALTALSRLLRSTGAPEFYIARFEALQDRANDESEPTAGGSSGRGRGREADPKPGQKRAGQAVETAPKRGKRVSGS